MTNDNLPKKSLKDQAQEIIAAVDRDLEAVKDKPVSIQKNVDAKADAILDRLFRIVSDVDIESAAARARALKAKHPRATPQELAEKLIRDKCQRTGTVGAVTSGAGLIPGIGTAAAVTLGTAADIGATFKLQAELVLEIAALYDYPLSDEEKQRLVMLITGISAGTNVLAQKAGANIALKAGERFAGRTLLKAIPFVGVLASAGTNVLSTYIIGQRADAYFRLGPEAVGSWADSLRTVSGLDERQIAGWLADSGRATGSALVAGASRVGQAGKTAGGAVLEGAGKAAETVGTTVGAGAKKAGATAQRGLRTYVTRLVAFWRAVFRLVGWLLGTVWTIIAFIPRKIAALFRRGGDS